MMSSCKSYVKGVDACLSLEEDEEETVGLLDLGHHSSSSSATGEFSQYATSDCGSNNTDMWDLIKRAEADESEDEDYHPGLRAPVEQAIVTQYVDCFRRQLVTFRVKRVVSPFEFYLECVVDPIGDHRTHTHYFSENAAFQKFYKDPRNQLERTLRRKQIIIGNCYACHFENLNDPSGNNFVWHRVRVLEVNSDDKTAFVLFCDDGRLEQVPFKKLRALEPEFTAVWRAQLLRCHLYDIVPSSSSQKFITSSCMNWSQEAYDYFQDLMFEYQGKEVMGMVMNRSKTKVKLDIGPHEWEEYVNLGVVLFETPSFFDKESSTCTINSLLVDRGFAKSIGIFSACTHQFEINKYLPCWDEKDFYEVYPHLKVEKTPVPSTSTPSNTVTISNEVLRFVTANAFNQGPPITSMPNLDGKPKKEIKSERGLPRNISERMCNIKLSYVDGPDYIIVHNRWQIESLKKLEKCLGSTMRYEIQIRADTATPCDIVPGMFLACQITDPKPNVTFWLRGVALTMPSENGRLKLLTIDYGNVPWVHRNRCRPLPEFFQKIPSFAIRCHLDLHGRDWRSLIECIRRDKSQHFV